MIVAWDSFARSGLERTCHGPGTYDWCGQKCRRVFMYSLSREGDRGAEFLGRPYRGAKVFCNLACYRAYFS
jgi:hypothetical protein